MKNKKKLDIDTRKLLGTIIGSIAFICCIIFFTYAFYTWRSSNTALNATIEDDSSSVKIEPEELTVTTTSLGPVLNPSDGEPVNFSVTNTSEEIANIYIDLQINTIAQELLDESFKYIIVKTTVSPANSTYDETTLEYNYDRPISSGNFANFSSGLTRIGQDTVPANTINFYKVLFYIDGNLKNDISMMDKSFEANLIVKNPNVDSKKIMLLGDTDGIPTANMYPLINQNEEFDVVYIKDTSSNESSIGIVELDIQQKAIELVNQYGAANLMVIIGAQDGDFSSKLAETFIAGDPSFSGPLCDVALNLDVYHILELKNESWVNSTIWNEQIASFEDSLDVDDIIAGMEEARQLKT